MPTLVSNEGTYRGYALATSVGVTTTGLPQFVIGVFATEWWDPGQNGEEGQWIPWEEYDEAITGYLCLFGKKGQPLKNAEQVMKVFGWDGADFDTLNDTDYSEIKFQFRVADEEYEGKVRRKLQFIDVFDATPGGWAGTVEKLDKDKCSALTKQFGNALKKLSGGKVKVAKAPTAKPTTPKKTTKKTNPPVVTNEELAEAGDPVLPVEETKAPTPPKRPAPPKKDKPSAKAKVTIEYTYETAWQAVVTATPEIEDDDRTTVWYEMLDQVAPGKDEDQITAEEWAAIVKYTIDELSTH